MAVYREEEPVVERRVVHDEPNTGLAGYAVVKYGFILLITIVVLYFIATQILDRF